LSVAAAAVRQWLPVVLVLLERRPTGEVECLSLVVAVGALQRFLHILAALVEHHRVAVHGTMRLMAVWVGVRDILVVRPIPIPEMWVVTPVVVAVGVDTLKQMQMQRQIPAVAVEGLLIAAGKTQAAVPVQRSGHRSTILLPVILTRLEPGVLVRQAARPVMARTALSSLMNSTEGERNGSKLSAVV
jgi:hypothetical protein